MSQVNTSLNIRANTALKLLLVYSEKKKLLDMTSKYWKWTSAPPVGAWTSLWSSSWLMAGGWSLFLWQRPNSQHKLGNCPRPIQFYSDFYCYVMKITQHWNLSRSSILTYHVRSPYVFSNCDCEYRPKATNTDMFLIKLKFPFLYINNNVIKVSHRIFWVSSI